MKILCVADQIDPLVYSSSIKSRFRDVELVLGAGDLPLEYYSFIVSCLNIPLYFVFGNHELSSYKAIKFRSFRDPKTWEDDVQMKEKYGAIYTGDKVMRQNRVLLAGLGGSMKYNNGLNQYTELQMFFKALKLLPGLIWNRLFHGRWLDILLTHAPPRDIHDKPDPCHRGFRVFRWFMHLFKPRYLVHGHVHLYRLDERRFTQFEHTMVVNAFNHVVLELEVPGG